jgi:hypothetical protein
MAEWNIRTAGRGGVAFDGRCRLRSVPSTVRVARRVGVGVSWVVRVPAGEGGVAQPVERAMKRSERRAVRHGTRACSPRP